MEIARTPIIDESTDMRETVVIDVDTYEDVYSPHETYEQVLKDKPWLFKAGQIANPTGRKAGKSMKEWMKEYLAKMTDEERMAFFKGMPKIDLWRMAEGNPTEDKHIKVSVPVPILGGASQVKALEDTSVRSGMDTAASEILGSE